jgi:hypothetical protein
MVMFDICNDNLQKKKGAAPVHVAPACAGSGEGSDHLYAMIIYSKDILEHFTVVHVIF